MTEYMQRVAHALESQFGQDWWLHGAHPQTVRDYVTARNEGQRAAALATMQRDACTYAINVLQCGIGAGLVAYNR